MQVTTHFVLWCFGFAKAETQTTAQERECLVKHARGKRWLAEIGCWHGVNTTRLREVMAPDGVLLAIDPYPTGRLRFSAQRYIARHTVSRINNGTLRWIPLTGKEAATVYASEDGPPIDFLFIDGDHSYEGIQGDWEGWSGLISPRGIVALHDSRSTPDRQIDNAGSVRYTQSVILSDPRFAFVEASDSLTILQRIDA